MSLRDDILAEADRWRGTKHQWQASKRGVACDCKGLVVGIARELGLPQARSQWALMRNYNRVDSKLLLHGISELFDPVMIGDERPSDLLVLMINRRPMHMAILGHGEIIHSYAGMHVTGSAIPHAFDLWPFHSAWAWRTTA